VLTEREGNQLLVIEKKNLRTIYSPKIVDGVYRSRNNFELDKEFNSPIVIGVVKSNIFWYAGHMIRGAEDLPQKALLRAVSEGRQNKGRTKSRWTDGVKSDSRAHEARFWENFARNRIQWKDLLRQVLASRAI
jgi:hypothetical protein